MLSVIFTHQLENSLNLLFFYMLDTEMFAKMSFFDCFLEPPICRVCLHVHAHRSNAMEKSLSLYDVMVTIFPRDVPKVGHSRGNFIKMAEMRGKISKPNFFDNLHVCQVLA